MPGVEVHLTEEAAKVVTAMESRVAAIGRQYGDRSSEYVEALQSLSRVLATILRLGGKVFRDDELSLVSHSFITFGVIWFSKRDGDGNRDPLLGSWSCHS